jgi:hypothetical protein
MGELERTLEEFTELQTIIREARSLEETIKLRKIAAKTADQLEALRAKVVVKENARICVQKTSL